MEARCPRCNSIVLVTDEARRTRVLDCPTCGRQFLVDPANDLKSHCSETRQFQADVSLEVTDQSWRLVASTRSLTEALPALMGGTSLVAFAGFFVWIGSRQPLPSFVFWCVPLWLAFFLLFVCLGAMRLGGRIEITIQGDQGTVFTGVGGLGRTQHFDWTDTLEIRDQHMTSRGVDFHEIVLHVAKKIRTGKFLTKEQSSEILQALRQLQRTELADDGS